MSTWIYAAVISAASFGINNLLMRLSAGRVGELVGALLIQGVSFALIVVYFVLGRGAQGVSTAVSGPGLGICAASGLAQVLGIIFLLTTFKRGGEVSVVIPFLLVVQLIIAAFAGAVFFHEPMGARKALGLGLCLVGILLASTK